MKNNGPDTAAGPITVTDDLIDQLAFISGGDAQVTCTIGAQRVTCTSGNLASGAEVSFQIVTGYSGNVSGITNTAQVSGAPGQLPEKTTANNSGTAKITLGAFPEPVVTPTASSGSPGYSPPSASRCPSAAVGARQLASRNARSSPTPNRPTTRGCTRGRRLTSETRRSTW